MRRHWKVRPYVDISEDADLSTAFSIAGADRGVIYIPSTFDGTKFILHVCDTADGTYLPLSITTDASVPEYTVAVSKAFALPETLFGAIWCKIETVTDQATTDTQFIVSLSGE
jgi:hypothetical protein